MSITRKLATIFLSGLLVGGLLSACAESGERRSTGQVIDDTTIATQTKAALLEDDVTHGMDIDVEVDRAQVQLNGFVDSQAQKDRAGEIARSVEGVASVSNNLEVSGGPRSTGEYVDDKVLFTRVNAALAQNSLTSALTIDVEVNRGVVSLGGHVDSLAQANAAVETAREVSGVTRVVNNLDVREAG
jgi:hyperosmotically inducible protein